ncbi:glycosyl hydrolase family 95 catalytic domain-containing protein [Parvularcula dongshanensis]|uniref:Alpha-L-fucosidase 2 n=1 Tax=Parvularcula dongshanensis TaxID=1173995 RepID=A0A840I5Z9_9PROT|nr:alpha-L-fucosidase 2 [Parvularcula dongshanensis]
MTAVAAGLFFGGKVSARTSERPAGLSRYGLWYTAPAGYWVEALPVGTGRLGAMVYGGTHREQLQINEDTFWAGGPYNPAVPGALDAIAEVRDLIWQERYREAQALADRELIGVPRTQMPYLTLGSLVLECDGGNEREDYVRFLDLARAATVTRWTAGGRRHERTVLASVPDEVILVRHRVDQGDLALTVSHERLAFDLDDQCALATGKNEGVAGVDGRLRFALGIAPCPGTTVQSEGGRLVMRGREEVAFVIAAGTSHRSWQDVSGHPTEDVRYRLSAASRNEPASIERAATNAHREAFETFDLDLGEDLFANTPTNERIRYSHEMNRHDGHLAALYVQYGRYLLLSSSRPGSQPANLQGVWNDSSNPAWGSKYTININTQMNYWPAEALALPNCVEPLIAMVEDLAESGRRTAQVHYGARGWVAHHNTDIWRATAPIDGAFWGMWPLGGAWLCQHLWDHYDYGRDLTVLKRIYPTLRDAGLFFLDTLVEHPGGEGLVTCPSISPENAHHPGTTICAGPACDRQILRKLFGNIIEASELLGLDSDLRAEFSSARSRLPADRIGKAGQLQEWLQDWDLDAPEIQHRHVSHLYAVYPGHEIGPDTPALYEAARRSLAIRGDDATGWGIGWRINLWARLGDADRAYTVLRKLLGPDRTYPNMFDAHPPFQIDGNFGGAAGVVEMLVRDRPQEIELLPALPMDAWPDGWVRGVRLRGGLTLDLNWMRGDVTEARFAASSRVRRKVHVNGRAHTLDMNEGDRVVVT